MNLDQIFLIILILYIIIICILLLPINVTGGYTGTLFTKEDATRNRNVSVELYLYKDYD